MVQVTTKTGDMGTTDMWDGRRVSKASLDINAMGALDELNSVIGLVKVQFSKTNERENKFRNEFNELQKTIMYLMGDYCYPYKLELSAKDFLNFLDAEILKLESEIVMEGAFIVPGTNNLDAHIDFARTVCRRVERVIVKKLEEDASYQCLATAINRLSDYFFLLSVKFREKDV